MRQESQWNGRKFSTQPYHPHKSGKQMEKRAAHFIASKNKATTHKRELMNMVNELLGIQYNIAKANSNRQKGSDPAAYINADTLRAIHKTMDRKKSVWD